MVTEKFNDFYMSHKNEIDDHINNIKESGDYNDLETRLAWDIARALRYWEWMPKDEQGYVGGTDAQCTTLFKQALRKSEIPYQYFVIRQFLAPKVNQYFRGLILYITI